MGGFIIILDYFIVCSYGDIRLSGGRNGTEGLVEICNGSSWGTVCDDLWGATDAQVVCNQLGFASTGFYFPIDAYVHIHLCKKRTFLLQAPLLSIHLLVELGLSFSTTFSVVEVSRD